jgi:adenylosuccinate lyase
MVKHNEGRDLYHASMKSVTSIDGRHKLATASLGNYFSEFALHKYRVLVEIKHLIKMSETKGFNIPKLSSNQKDKLVSIYTDFSNADAAIIADYDHFGRNGLGPFEHDVKSVEFFLRERLQERKLESLIPMVHYSLTSEDVNNFAYNLMIRESIKNIWLPKFLSVTDKLASLSSANKSVPMLSRTHGQPASPTTFGKEMAVYLSRLTNEFKELISTRLSGKLNGAVGNYNAQVTGSPNVDWIKYSQEFAKELGFDCELLTCQRGPKMRIAKLFQTIMRINTILRDFDINLWTYVSYNYVMQKPVASHVGSSVMPHKINPWQLECSEGATEMSNALLGSIINEVEVSRLQRDLSDHEQERGYGNAIAYSLVALDYVDDFLTKVYVNPEAMLKDLEDNKQILSEAFQTILRAEGVPNAYEIFKDAFRGNNVSNDELVSLIDSLKVKKEVKTKMKSLKVTNYIGLAEKLTEISIREYKSILHKKRN